MGDEDQDGCRSCTPSLGPAVRRVGCTASPDTFSCSAGCLEAWRQTKMIELLERVGEIMITEAWAHASARIASLCAPAADAT